MQEILSSTSPIAGMSRHQNASTPVNDDQARLKLPVIKSEIDPSSTIAFNQYSYPIGYEQNNFSVDSISKSDNAGVEKSQQMNSWKANSSSLLMKTTSPVSSTSSATYENLVDAAKKEEANNASGYPYSYSNQFQRPPNMVQSSSSLIAALASHPGSHYLQTTEAVQHSMSAANYNCQSALKYSNSNFYNPDSMNSANFFAFSNAAYSESSNGPSFPNHAGMIAANGAVSHAFTNEFGYDMKTATGVRNLSPSNATSKLETNTNMYSSSSSSSSSAPSSSSSSFSSSPQSLLNIKNSSSPSNSRSDNSTSSSSSGTATTAATSSAGQGLNANFAMAPGSSSIKDEPMPATFGWMKPNKGLVNGKTRTKDKYRVVYTEPQRLQLEAEFLSGNYITIKRKNELSSVLNLTERQIKIWFQNRRAKERKKNRRVKLNGGNNNVSSTTPSIKREDMYDGYDEDEDDDEDDETEEDEDAYMDDDDGQMSENKLKFAKREPSEAGEADKRANSKGGKDKKSTAKATSTTGSKKTKTSKPPSVTNNSNTSSNLNNSSSTDEHYSGENRSSIVGNLFNYNQNSLQFPAAYSTSDQLAKSGLTHADGSISAAASQSTFPNLLPAQHHPIAYTGMIGGIGGASAHSSSAASTSSASSSSSSSSSSPTSTPLYSTLMPPSGGYPNYTAASSYHQYFAGCASMQQDPYGAAAVAGNHYQNFHPQSHLNYYNQHASSQALSAYSAQHQQQIAASSGVSTASSDYHGLQYQLDANSSSAYTHHFQAQPQSQVSPFQRTASNGGAGSEYLRETAANAGTGASSNIASSSPLLFANIVTSQY